ncbi:MAG: transposase [Muribaculaceae bacterium]
MLNYFRRRATNASAESFNAKIKMFRAQLRGVSDHAFFIFRLTKLSPKFLTQIPIHFNSCTEHFR